VDAEWFYIGHYGQLGPLTRDQFDELIEGGVIGRETFVWKTGMADWLPADKVPQLAETFTKSNPFLSPPPMPQAPPPPGRGFPGVSAPQPSYMPGQPLTPPQTEMVPRPGPSIFSPSPLNLQQPGIANTLYPGGIRSDKSRALAGILGIILPGVGRMYLGYSAIGALQLLFTVLTCGSLWLWSFVDGIFILCGGVKTDGYGRVLVD